MNFESYRLHNYSALVILYLYVTYILHLSYNEL